MIVQVSCNVRFRAFVKSRKRAQVSRRRGAIRVGRCLVVLPPESLERRIQTRLSDVLYNYVMKMGGARYIRLVLEQKMNKETKDMTISQLSSEHRRLFTAGNQILSSGAYNSDILKRRIVQMRSKGAPQSEIDAIVRIHVAREKNARDQINVLNTYTDEVMARASDDERKEIESSLMKSVQAVYYKPAKSDDDDNDERDDDNDGETS